MGWTDKFVHPFHHSFSFSFIQQILNLCRTGCLVLEYKGEQDRKVPVFKDHYALRKKQENDACIFISLVVICVIKETHKGQREYQL